MSGAIQIKVSLVQPEGKTGGAAEEVETAEKVETVETVEQKVEETTTKND